MFYSDKIFFMLLKKTLLTCVLFTCIAGVSGIWDSKQLSEKNGAISQGE